MAAPNGTRWAISGTVANGLVGSRPSLQLGETAQFEFQFRPSSDLPDHLTRVQEITSLFPHAGDVALIETIEGYPRFREQTPTGVSPLLQLEPGTGSVNSRAIWGLLMAGEIDDPNPNQQVKLRLSVAYLGDVADYPTESDLRTAIEV